LSIPNNIGEIDEKLLSTLYFRHIYKRVHDLQFNFLGFFTGKHRVGKSLSSLSYSYALDPSFASDIENRVVYYAEDFMKALEHIRQKKIIGGAIVWDEADVGIPAREWYNISNKAINMALQVFGRYRPIVFFVTQDPSYIDSSARKLFHGFYETTRVANRYANVKAFNVSYDKRNGKIYYIYTRIAIPNGDASGITAKLKYIKIRKPPKEIENKYEDHSKTFKDRIMQQMKERTEMFREGGIKPKKMSVNEIVHDLAVEHVNDPKYLSKRSKEDYVIFDANAISYYYDISARQSQLIKKNAEIQANKVEDVEKSNKPE